MLLLYLYLHVLQKFVSSGTSVLLVAVLKCTPNQLSRCLHIKKSQNVNRCVSSKTIVTYQYPLNCLMFCFELYDSFIQLHNIFHPGNPCNVFLHKVLYW